MTETDDQSIVINPALDGKPIKPYTVANWKKIDNFKLDLQVKPDSPAFKLGEDGKPIGSKINIEKFRQCDFNGDGKRDVPKWPTDISWNPD